MDLAIPGFIDFFKEVPDHRIERGKIYVVEEILLVAFCGIIAGCDSWDDLELFGKSKIDYLQKYLPYNNGTPSDDTLRRFFRALDTEQFEACFIEWVKAFQINYRGKVVAIDGKTSRRSFDGEVRAMHMLSAFASEIGITIGQLKVDGKANEITAIPKLLDILDVEGATITMDSIGCQTKIVDKILQKNAHYVVGLKGNQGTLHDDVKLLFDNKPSHIEFFTFETIEKGHGRIEKRKCTVTQDIAWLREHHARWKGLCSIIEIESTRELKKILALKNVIILAAIKLNLLF